ncbi:MAG: serine/threonine protein kinase [Myxococcales bacterium]|nr:serine/threonine protein kinase [Myxococcales bacterium]
MAGEPQSPRPPEITYVGGPIEEGVTLEGRYRVEKRLGEGAMGAVFLVEHIQLRKRYALKVLLPESVASPEIIARFEREAIAAGNIDHPNVAKATDFGRLADGSFFLVLEYVGGQSLRTLLEKEGGLEQRRAVGLARQVLAALHAAHSKGVIHRDIKPENVMLTHAGSASGGAGASGSYPALVPETEIAKVLDFGIAKVTEELAPASEAAAEQPLTRMGAMYGTPAYMSPEQAMGEVIDVRADLYATGVMLYEMLAGRPPFDGEPLEVVMHHLHDPPPPLVSPRGPIDPAIHAVVDRLLQKDRAARFATAQEALDALDAIEASFLVVVAPIAGEGVEPLPRKRAWLPIAIGGGALAFVLMLALVLGGSDHEPEATPPPKKPKKVMVAEPASTSSSSGGKAEPQKDDDGPKAESSAAPSGSAVAAASASASGKAKGQKKSLVQKIKGLF